MDIDEIWKEPVKYLKTNHLKYYGGTVVSLSIEKQYLRMERSKMLGVGEHTVTYNRITHIFNNFHQLIYVIYLQSMLFSCCLIFFLHFFFFFFFFSLSSIHNTIKCYKLQYNFIFFDHFFHHFHLIKYYKIDYTKNSIHFSPINL